MQIGEDCLLLTGQVSGLAGTQRLDVGYSYLQGESRAENHMIGKHLTELVLKKGMPNPCSLL